MKHLLLQAKSSWLELSTQPSELESRSRSGADRQFEKAGNRVGQRLLMLDCLGSERDGVAGPGLWYQERIELRGQELGGEKLGCLRSIKHSNLSKIQSNFAIGGAKTVGLTEETERSGRGPPEAMPRAL